MDIKEIHIDVETTGLYAFKHAITQLSGVIDINGKEAERFDFRCRPHEEAEVDMKALEANGQTADEIAEWENPAVVFDQFTSLLQKYVNPFDKNDKAYFVAYNAKFDEEFVRKFFSLHGKRKKAYYGSFFHQQAICTMILMNFHLKSQRHMLPNFKLGTVSAACGLTPEGVGLHDGMTDVLLSRGLYNIAEKYTIRDHDE